MNILLKCIHTNLCNGIIEIQLLYLSIKILTPMSKIQDKMFRELRNKEIFDLSQRYAFEYLDDIFERNVYPTQDALENLSVFEESLPIDGAEPKKVLEQLHTYGSPATTATLGGRYFGFVTGSAVPVGLAAKNLGTYWDQAPAMNVLSPIGSKLESVVEKWLVDLFNLPLHTAAGFVSGNIVSEFMWFSRC